MTKKLISLFLICVMMLSVLVAGAKQNDTYDTNASDVIKNLKIMSDEADGEFHPEKALSRSEGAEAIAKILFGDVTSTPSEPVFGDIDSSSVIHLLCHAGVLSRAELFRPNADLSAQQAVTMITRLMGYEIVASSKGGYPAGYMAVAAECGILDGIDLNDYSSGITKGQFAQMLYNALEVPWIEVSSYGDDLSYTKNNNSNILSAMSVKTFHGKIIATEHVSIDGAPLTGSGRVSVKNTSTGVISDYSISDSINADSMVNLDSVIYVSTRDSSSGVILYADSGELECLTIAGSQIVSVSNSEIRYIDEEYEEETVILSDDLAVIYNERGVAGSKHLYLQPQLGAVNLYRLSGEKVFKTAHVYDYDVIIADRGYEEGIIAKKPGGGTQTVDLSSYSDVTVVRDGKKTTLTSIILNDVVHIAKSADGQYVKVDASSKSYIHGTLTEKSDSDVKIGEIFYQQENNVITNEVYGKLALGESATFYFNANGRIFAYEIDDIIEKDMRGYILASSTGTGMAKYVKFKVLNEYGVISIYDTTDKFKVTVSGSNTEYTLTPSTISACSELFDLSGNAVGQFVKYKLNSDGKIKSIQLAKDLSLSGQDYDENNFSLVRSGSLRYDNFNGGKFDNQYMMTSTTKVFIISGDGDETKMRITTPSNAFAGIYNNRLLSDGEVFLYDANEYYQVPYVIYKYEGTPKYIPSNTSTSLVVDRVVHSVRASGETGYKLYGYTGGKSVKYFLSEEINPNELSQGDLILYSLDDTGTIMGIKKIFDYNADSPNYVESYATDSTSKNDAANWRADITVFYGNVYAITPNADYAVISTELPWDVKRAFKVSANYYIYDTQKGEISVAKATDLNCSYDNPVRVVARLSVAAIKDVVIIK